LKKREELKGNIDKIIKENQTKMEEFRLWDQD